MTTTNQPRRYELDELLRMRISLPVVCCLVKNFNKHPDTAGIFNIPDEALRRPEHFTYKSAHLADTTNRLRSHQLSRKNLTDSSEQSESWSVSESRNVQDLQHSRWNLRRRDVSDRTSQPHSAPTELAAQQSENFQRFYRAVVSPTHVRVTAGGRIVPNTRSPAPPSLEWNDKAATEFDLNNLQPKSLGSHLPTAHPPIAQGSYLPQDSTEMPSHGTKSAEESAGLSQQSIKISPPTQFDQTKPFLYNGQIVYPVPQGFQPPPSALPVPVSMLGNPGFYLPAGYHPTPFPPHFPGGPSPMMFAPGQANPMMAMPSPMLPAENLGMAPFMPIPGLIAPSDFMQSQIHLLYSHLKQIDNQLANNEHQTEVSMMESQRSALLSQINNMETLLRVHLGQDSNTGSQVARRIGQASGSYDEQKSYRALSHGSYLRPELAPRSEFHGDRKSSARYEQSSKSKLSIAAAMAPAFEPRSKTVMIQPTQPLEMKPSSLSTSAIQDLKPNDAQAEIEARMMAKATSNWSAPIVPHGSPSGYATIPRSYTHHERSIQGQKQHQHPTFQRASTENAFNSQAYTANAGSSTVSSTSVPYLVGVLPLGFNIQGANPNDLVYGRPLTDDELRARYLYFGKAPRSVQSGLPKFDGKDFYPPSPVKGKASLAKSEHVSSSVPDYLKPMDPKEIADLHFENLFMEKGVPGYRSPSPTRPSATGPKLKPALQPIYSAARVPGDDDIDFSTLFTEPGVPGYRSPPPHIKQSEVSLSKKIDGVRPVTPDNPAFSPVSEDNKDDTRSSGCWKESTDSAARDASINSQKSDAQGSESTVEIRLTARANGSSPKAVRFQDRAESSKSDQRTKFLQPMYKNAPQAPIVGAPLSGTISSATAQGYLPQYRGAAASLAPSEGGKSATGSSALYMAINSASENRPLSQQNARSNPKNAEAYLKYVVQQGMNEDDFQVLQEGW